MKSTRKHDLQTNELADFIGRAFQDAKPHANVIGYAALGLAILVLAFILIVLPLISGGEKDSGSSGALAKAVSGKTSEAMRAFLATYSDSPQAPVARMLLGQRLLSEAVRTGSVETVKANLKDAREAFETVVRTSPDLEPMAKVGLALVTVQEGNMKDGLAALESVVKQYPDSIAAVKAKETMDRLKDYKHVDFSSDPPDTSTANTGYPMIPGVGPRVSVAPTMPVSPTPPLGVLSPIPVGAWPTGAMPKTSGTEGLPSSLVPGRP
jgi:hypothetical protein